MTIQVEAATTLNAFEVLRPDWNRLALRGGTIFQTWEWSWAWWLRYRRGRRLLILVIKDGPRPIAIVPLFVAGSYAGLPFKIVGLLGTGHSDYGGIPAEEGFLEAAVGASVGYLRDLGGWDVIDLHQIPGHAPEAGALRRTASEFGLAIEEVEQDVCYALPLPDDWEAMLARLSKKFRWNIGYYRRRLEREHELVIRRPVEDSQVEWAVREFLRLHRKRWLSKKKPGRYLSPAFSRFIPSVASLVSAQGWLRLYLMEIDGAPVAALLGFRFGSGFYYYLGGFEPEWGGMSVSTVLLSEAVRESISEGLSHFDFLRGEESYKKRWQAVPTSNHRFILSREGGKADLARRILLKEGDLAGRAKARLAAS